MSFTNFAARRILNSWIGADQTLRTPNYGTLTGTGRPTHLAAILDEGGGSAPSEDGSNFTEPSGNGYARFELPNTTGAGFSTATDADPSVIQNDASITFAAASGGNHGTIKYVAFFDAASGGNPLFLVELTTPRAINDGEALSFEAGQLQIRLD